MDWMRPDQPGDRPQRRDVFPKVTDDKEWTFPARRRGLRRHPHTPALSLISCAPESTCTHSVRDTEKILADRGQPNLRQGTDHKSSPPACVLPCDWETCDTGGSLAVRPDPSGGPAPSTQSRPQGCRFCIPPNRSWNPHDVNDIHPEFRALTTTAHSGRHVANRSL
ncbi:hypothetical protein CJ179_49465 [Rhodococcus sp. ACS1]|uniref:hypothetical protein n=1 Tax=Rhodococcus sp. ACS1 TaxID=2028570 RepID=UPI000BB0E0A2|nr:hypothetical protein [Rhodococcus sp. ACS1]PBC35264.1 hypothetical protein CJ179_49465 [Rhodococcus sp. ACS1]